jgi:hypothetical protein
MSSMFGKRYDKVYVGTSVISVLDAIHFSNLGQKVLMIDNQPAMGGAWRTIEAFGLHDVENAIHYFLPYPGVHSFMKEKLNWSVIRSPRKFRIFSVPYFGRVRLPYDSPFGRVMGRAIETSKSSGLFGFIESLPSSVLWALREPYTPSHYVAGGSKEMLDKVEQLLATSDVEVSYSTEILSVAADNKTGGVIVTTTGGDVQSSMFIVSHGTKIPHLEGFGGALNINHKIHPRPAAHMLIEDSANQPVYEAVFTGDPIIKYAHDVTRFTREATSILGRLKVIVFALRNEIQESDAVYETLLEKLRWAGMVGPDAVVKSKFWSNIFLPSIDDEDLAKIKTAFRERVDYLRTENFAAGLGYYAPRWGESFERQHLKIYHNFIKRV